jgi:predicted transcriptional regulator
MMSRNSNKPTLDKETKSKIRRLYNEGVKQSALAERFGISQAMVSFILKER